MFQVVVANILHTRKKTVVLVTPYDEYAIWMADSELDAGKEIEERIVSELVKRHIQFIGNNAGKFQQVMTLTYFRSKAHV